jgi:hypothetical protein
LRFSMRKDSGNFNIFMSFKYIKTKNPIAGFQSYRAIICESIGIRIEQKY